MLEPLCELSEELTELLMIAGVDVTDEQAVWKFIYESVDIYARFLRSQQ